MEGGILTITSLVSIISIMILLNLIARRKYRKSSLWFQGKLDGSGV